jgi:hypothetical protein
LVNHRLRAGTSARPAGRRPVGAPGRALARSACRLLALLGGLALVVGCASYTEETREIRSLYKAEAYREALDKLDATDIKEQSRNRLLYRLEKAMILDRLGEGKRARTLLIEADKIVDELYTTSVSRTAASFLVNDAQGDYEGEDYEKVAIHTQMALSFLADGDLGSARVEARKINNKLHEINQGYDADTRNRYAEDAFARYLAGTIYEARGELDDAIIDYGRAVELYAGSFASFVSGGVPDALVKSYWRLLKKRNRADKLSKLEKDYEKLVELVKKEDEELGAAFGEVVVVHELGHIATKSTSEFFITVGSQLVRFSFPVIKKRESYLEWRETGLQVSGGKLFRGENVADMDEIARATLDDRRGRLVAKQMTRLLAKGQLAEQARQNFGPLAGIAANVFTAVTETADTRSWTLLPEGYFLTRARLKPGTYTVELKTGGRIGQIKTIKVEPGKMILLRDAG